jgi:uncharacterized protein
MLRVALLIIFFFVIARAFWRLLDGVVEGISRASNPGGQVPSRGVQMVRDPVCGTFLVPDKALTLVDGHQRLYFCSDACRDAYRKRA